MTAARPQEASPGQAELAAAQFGRTAQSYLVSAVHSQGADLERLAALAQSLGNTLTQAGGIGRPMSQAGSLGCPLALDLGCGAGHAAFALARGGAAVTAYDLSAEMLDVVAAEAARRGHAIRTAQGPAERLPFADASFNLVATRFSAHHWGDVPGALREARRVLRPDGTLAVIDAVAPESPLADTVLQTVELLRDASHVRDYRLSEWAAMLADAGFARPDAAQVSTWKLRMMFGDWVARMRTPEVRVRALHDVLSHAPDEARRHFNIDADSCFDLDVAWMQTVPA
jgi:SAM-dependent methyltransferase